MAAKNEPAESEVEQGKVSETLARKGSQVTARPTQARAGRGDGPQNYRRTTDKAEAEQVVSEVYLPNRLDLLDRDKVLDMELAGIRLGAVTAGRLSYGRDLRIVTGETQNFHVNLPLRGQAVSSSGHGDAEMITTGQAAVFPLGEPAVVLWPADCVQLCLMVPRANVQDELERLLGRSVHQPLTFEFKMDLHRHPGRGWQSALQFVLAELKSPSGLADHQVAGRHIENLLLDGLLLAQPHNYTEVLAHSMDTGPVTPVGRAVELLQERPEEPWTTSRLARAVHMSVRSLQEGFSRDYDVPPMAYLRQVRLRQVRAVLVDATPNATTVQSVATRLGFLHLGRFSANYRHAFGENPSETLRRESR
jgi:AraC-like DNA-binding protein